MTLSPAQKGQLTKVVKAAAAVAPQPKGHLYRMLRLQFEKFAFPAEQAKHAAKRYLASVAA